MNLHQKRFLLGHTAVNILIQNLCELKNRPVAGAFQAGFGHGENRRRKEHHIGLIQTNKIERAFTRLTGQRLAGSALDSRCYISHLKRTRILQLHKKPA
jgi:hypothetical protein